MAGSGVWLLVSSSRKYCAASIGVSNSANLLGRASQVVMSHWDGAANGQQYDAANQVIVASAPVSWRVQELKQAISWLNGTFVSGCTSSIPLTIVNGHPPITNGIALSYQL